LRHDIQVLADYGVIRGPITTWPLSWDAIVAELQTASDNKLNLPSQVRQTMDRLLVRAMRETERRQFRMNSRLSVAEKPSRIRSFRDTPRENGELLFGVSWAGERLTLNLNVTGAYERDDGQEARADGSQIAVDIGNLTLAASTLERWWGPGWDGSLILSNNARPIPAITMSRIRTDAFKSKWLSWIGPWDFSLIWGQLEEERVVPNAQFFGLRFNFRPVPSLEIGLSRTAQWCGDGRPCDFDTFKNLLLGKGNRGDAGTTLENEPGNQLAGFDIRWTNHWLGRPMSIYSQLTGEDEAVVSPAVTWRSSVSRSVVSLKTAGRTVSTQSWPAPVATSLRTTSSIALTTTVFTRPVIACAVGSLATVLRTTRVSYPRASCS
jgi:hypothetical protein